MYRVNILTKGNYNNGIIGVRYCLTKEQARETYNLFHDNQGSECEVYKFIVCGLGIFGWNKIFS